MSATDDATLKRKPGRPTRDTGAHDDTRQQLIQTAARLFASRGFDAVSTGLIAREAGMAQSMVHYHFGSKEILWRAAVDWLMHRRGDAIAMRSPQRQHMSVAADPLNDLRIKIWKLVAASGDEPDLVRIVMHEAISNSDRYHWFFAHYVRNTLGVIEGAISSAQAGGALRHIDSAASARIVTAAATMTLGFAISGLEETEQSGAYVEMITDLLFQGLTGLDASRGPEPA